MQVVHCLRGVGSAQLRPGLDGGSTCMGMGEVATIRVTTFVRKDVQVVIERFPLDVSPEPPSWVLLGKLRGTVAVAIRGTNNWINAIQDMDTALVRVPTLRCLLHREFSQIAEAILPDIWLVADAVSAQAVSFRRSKSPQIPAYMHGECHTLNASP